jgi:hypothetical protein
MAGPESAHAPSVPRRRLRPGLLAAPQKGCAERRGLAGPHGLVSKVQRDTRDVTTSPGLSGRPARDGLRFYPCEPRRTDQASLLGQALLSAADRELSPDAPYLGHTNAPVPGAPCGTRRNARRTQQASTAATCLRNTPRPPLPRSALRNAFRKAPLRERGWIGI